MYAREQETRNKGMEDVVVRKIFGSRWQGGRHTSQFRFGLLWHFSWVISQISNLGWEVVGHGRLANQRIACFRPRSSTPKQRKTLSHCINSGRPPRFLCSIS